MTVELMEGERILEWGHSLCAQFCGRLLADLGAEVIKIEAPSTGDPLRRRGPFSPDAAYADGSTLFAYLSYGKRSITLDPLCPSGADLLARLGKSSDVLIDGQSAGTLERCGLPVATLQAHNPSLTVLSVTSFGQSGTLKDYFCSELTLQHLAGFAYHQAAPVTHPAMQPPLGGADHEGALGAGIAAAVAAIWGMLLTQAGAPGPHIDFAEADFQAHLLVDQLAAWSRGERQFARQREPGGGVEIVGGLVWMLPCSDGWVMISPREQHQWDRWMELIGNPIWSRDTALCGDRVARKANGVELQRLMSEWTCMRTRQEVSELSQSARVACFPVSTSGDLLKDAQLAQRKFFHRLRLSDRTSIPVPGVPFRIIKEGRELLPRGESVRAPSMGEANDEIFRGRLGLTPAEVESLRRQGIV